MSAVLNELLPKTPLEARTRKAEMSKKPRFVEEEAVPLIRDQMGSPHLRQFNVCNTMQVRSWACRRAMPKRGSGSKGQHAGMAQRAHAAV